MKVQIFRLLLSLTFTKFVMSFLKPRASFSSNFASLSSVMRNNSSVLFHVKLYIPSRKRTLDGYKFSKFQLLAWKLTKFQIPQFSLEFCITFQCHDTQFLWNFLPETLHFGQKEPIKVQIFRILSAWMKVHPSPHVSFETTRLRFIQILQHCSVSWKITPLYFFYLTPLYFGQKEPIKVKLSNFWVVGLKFTKFLMSCLKLLVSFSLNFVSLFSAMRDNSSVL